MPDRPWPSPQRYRDRRRRRRWAIAVGLLLAGSVLGWLDRAGWGWYEGDAADRYEGARVRVVEVIDGDTFDARLQAGGGGSAVVRIRLWGLDTPETAKPARPDRGEPARPAEPWADIARERARALLEGREVTLDVEAHRLRGRFGRLLAHVALPDGRWLNELLLAEGLARAERRWSHSRLDRYASLEREARLAGLGLWSGGDGRPPR